MSVWFVLSSLADRLVTGLRVGAVRGNQRNPLHSVLEFQLTKVVEVIRAPFVPPTTSFVTAQQICTWHKFKDSQGEAGGFAR